MGPEPCRRARPTRSPAADPGDGPDGRQLLTFSLTIPKKGKGKPSAMTQCPFNPTEPAAPLTRAMPPAATPANVHTHCPLLAASPHEPSASTPRAAPQPPAPGSTAAHLTPVQNVPPQPPPVRPPSGGEYRRTVARRLPAATAG